MIVPDVKLVVEGAAHCHADEVAEEHWQDEQLRLYVRPGVHLHEVTVT